MFTNCEVLFKLNNLHNFQRGFSSPSENSDLILAERLGVEPSLPLQVVQISNLVPYRPAPAPHFSIGTGSGSRTLAVSFGD